MDAWAPSLSPRRQLLSCQTFLVVVRWEAERQGEHKILAGRGFPGTGFRCGAAEAEDSFTCPLRPWIGIPEPLILPSCRAAAERHSSRKLFLNYALGQDQVVYKTREHLIDLVSTLLSCSEQ